MWVREREREREEEREKVCGWVPDSAARVVDEVVQGAPLCQLHGDAEELVLMKDTLTDLCGN